MHRLPRPILDIQLIPFGLPAPKEVYIIKLSNRFNSVPGEGSSINASCVLNYISTFVLRCNLLRISLKA